jgi:selenocysteine lyase/cysteine desulfurase
VSYGVAIALHNCPLAPGRSVVTPEQEFPSDVYGWIERCRASGAELRRVPRPEGSGGLARRWSERMLEAIGPDTAAVTLSTVHWTDGVRFDVEAIAERAREVGALLVLDGTQSIGAAPFDFERVRPDLLVGAAYKWLLGPYQIGFAAVGDRLIEGEPFEYHWSNRKGSEDVSGVDYRLEYRDGARRFDVGEHANDLPVSMLETSVSQVLEWSPAAITDYCARLTEPLEDFLAEGPFTSAPPAERCAHILGIRFPEPARLERALGKLAERDVRVSRRGDSLRISPYLYNTAADVEALLDGLRSVL